LYLPSENVITMKRKEYHVKAIETTPHKHEQNENYIKEEILRIIDTAFSRGAVVEIKVLEGVDLANDGKRFSKVRMDIISNTDFDSYEL
jgi:hypothetical protein